MEGDSKILIDSLTGITQIPWRIKFLVQDILWIASRVSHIHFVHIWREGNFVADVITKASHFVDESVWDCCLPLNVASVFHLDQLGCGCSRGFVV